MILGDFAPTVRWSFVCKILHAFELRCGREEGIQGERTPTYPCSITPCIEEFLHKPDFCLTNLKFMTKVHLFMYSECSYSVRRSPFGWVDWYQGIGCVKDQTIKLEHPVGRIEQSMKSLGCLDYIGKYPTLHKSWETRPMNLSQM